MRALCPRLHVSVSTTLSSRAMRISTESNWKPTHSTDTEPKVYKVHQRLLTPMNEGVSTVPLIAKFAGVESPANHRTGPWNSTSTRVVLSWILQSNRRNVQFISISMFSIESELKLFSSRNDRWESTGNEDISEHSSKTLLRHYRIVINATKRIPYDLN